MNQARTSKGINFDAQVFLTANGLAGKPTHYVEGAVIYGQGDRADNVLYIKSGTVKLTVVNNQGKKITVATFGPGDFFGEGCMAGQPRRIGTTSVVAPATLISVEKKSLMKALRAGHELAGGFISFLLARNIRTEEDLIGQLFSSTEKRLARILLLLARYGEQSQSQMVIPNSSRGRLASLVGVPRSRINFCMKKFKKLGFIETRLPLRINESLLTVVLHE
jgi:CRP/FNR family transcriptional regulator, cyclic AMP receptor protein